MTQRSTLTRRQFLRLGLAAGSSIALAPFLKACASIERIIPTEAVVLPTPDSLVMLDGLDIDAFLVESFKILILRDPEGLTELGIADFYGVGDGNLTNVSDVYIRETQALESGILERLRGYDRAAFTRSQALSADIYEWYLDDLVRGHEFMYDDYPISPVVASYHLRLFFLFLEYQPLNDEQDARDYLSRLSQVGTKIDQIIEGLEHRQDRGVILPAFIIQAVLPDLTSIANATAIHMPYYQTFKDKLTAAGSIPAATLQDLFSQAEQQVDLVVIPAYKRLVDTMQKLYKLASDKIGAWQFEDGEGYYAWTLRHHTTSSWEPEQISALGEQNLARIHDEMRLQFTALGYPEGNSITALYNRLTTEGGVYRGQGAVTAYEDAIQQAQQYLPRAFDIFPEAEVTVVGGPAGDFYMSPAFDGSRPGIFFARTSGATPVFGVKTLAFHETIPGHHFQIAIAMELPDQPAFRLAVNFTGFAEGWALYSERLMMELGAYDGDIPGDLGRLQAEAFRSARLVVDTGIHTGRMDFDTAVDFLADATGFQIANAQREITRYSVMPGQATAYYLGFLKLLELRQKALDNLGSGFDLKAFHRVILGNGSVPLQVLETLIDAYIEENV